MFAWSNTRLNMDTTCCVFIWTNLLLFVYSQDPCSTTRYLTGDTRSVDYLLSASDPDPCDRLIQEGWYRIEANGTIPTECPPILRCGSTSPIWLNGALPTTNGQRVTLNACQRGFLECCDFSFPIQVQNCGHFNVFWLTSTPGCPGRYCTQGPPAPCAPGMASETGFEPCQRLDITFSVTPTVEPYLPTMDPTSNHNKLAFRCKTPTMQSEYQQYFFDIAWFIDKKKVNETKNIPYNALSSRGDLHQVDWDPHGNSTLGFWITCKIRARQSTVSPPTPYNTSKEFFAGVRVTPAVSNVKAGTEVKIQIQSTVPVACRNIYGRTSCNVHIEMFSFKDQFGSLPAQCNDTLTDSVKPATCGTTMDGSKWKTGHTFSIHTQLDQSTRSSYTCAVQLIAKSRVDTLWFNYNLPEILIHVTKEIRPSGLCYTRNDPHLQTFDGRKYTSHDAGEFVLFKHKTKPIEVNTIHKRSDTKLYDSYAYNCAIAIRAAADVFVIYGCDDPVKWIIKRLNCDNEHQYLEIYERGKQYQVVLPTGTRIDIYINESSGKNWLNIYVNVSPSDWNQLDGLCGTYNGNSNDDFTNRAGNVVSQDHFIQSWSVPRSQSLYVAKSRTEKLKTEVMYCSCFNHTTIGEAGYSESADCGWKDSLPLCKPLNFKENRCKFRGKRELEDDLELDVPFDVVDFTDGPKEFPWKNGWTEEKAVNICTSFANQSKLYQTCSKLSNIHANSDLDTCVADIRISGSDSFLSSSLDIVKSACLNELVVNTTFWKKKTPEVTTKPTQVSATTGITISTTPKQQEIEPSVLSALEEIVDTVFELDCPGDCSNAGTCNQGICECNDGYSGEDCSVNTRIPPELYGLSRESLCDVSKRPCSSVSLFGSGFYESPSLICQIIQAKIQDNKFIPGDLSTTVDGYLETFAELRCPLSEVHWRENRTLGFQDLDIFLIAVSFNKINFSSPSPIVVYDANCIDCRLNGEDLQCEEKREICKIGTRCYDIRDEICHPKSNVSMTTRDVTVIKDTTESMATNGTMTNGTDATKDNGKTGRTRNLNYLEIWKIGAVMGGLSVVIVPTLLILKR